jgi:hypothetical protein
MPKKSVYNRGMEEEEGKENRNKTLENKLHNKKLKFIIFISIGILLWIVALIGDRYYVINNHNHFNALSMNAIVIILWLIIWYIYPNF